jgi:hypothetical protein
MTETSIHESMPRPESHALSSAETMPRPGKVISIE